jgi:hypothetical protein
MSDLTNSTNSTNILNKFSGMEFSGTVFIDKIECIDDSCIILYFDSIKTSKFLQVNLSSFIKDNSITLKTYSNNFYRFYKDYINYKDNKSTKIYFDDFKRISNKYAVLTIIINNTNNLNINILKSISIKESFSNFDKNNKINKTTNNKTKSSDTIYINKFTYRKETIKNNILDII